VHVSTIKYFSNTCNSWYNTHTIHLTQIKLSTFFATQVPSSGIYYNIDVQANLLIYVLFIVTSLFKTPVVKIHNICTKYTKLILLIIESVLILHELHVTSVVLNSQTTHAATTH
jgi:hypothetical protein